MLLGPGLDPVTGEPLGRAYPSYVSVADRIAERVAVLDPGLGIVERAEVTVAIEAEEAERGLRRAVAGYEFTFSLPKSASVLWALADASTQATIADAHHAADPSSESCQSRSAYRHKLTNCSLYSQYVRTGT